MKAHLEFSILELMAASNRPKRNQYEFEDCDQAAEPKVVPGQGECDDERPAPEGKPAQEVRKMVTFSPRRHR